MRHPDAPTPERVAQEFRQADEELGAAETLLKDNRLNVAISSTYYACFHAVRALLYRHGLMPKTHKGVAVEFSRQFVKAGILSREWNNLLEK